MGRIVKCSECKIKIGLFGLSCRCKGADNIPRIFCSLCITPKPIDIGGHICTFDYICYNREQITKNNPKLESSKIKLI